MTWSKRKDTGACSGNTYTLVSADVGGMFLGKVSNVDFLRYLCQRLVDYLQRQSVPIHHPRIRQK